MSAPTATEPPRDELDLRGLLCPIPVIRCGERAADLAAGTELLLLCTDPGVEADLPLWCRMHGHAWLGVERDGDTLRARLRIGGAAAGDPGAGSASDPGQGSRFAPN